MKWKIDYVQAIKTNYEDRNIVIQEKGPLSILQKTPPALLRRTLLVFLIPLSSSELLSQTET